MSSAVANRVALAVGCGVLGAVAGVGLAAALSDEVRVLDLSRDPATLSGSPAYEGLLTYLGGFAWAATIVIALFGSWMLDLSGAPPDRVRFLRWSAAISFVLMVDDVFLVHERLVPRLGLSEVLLFAGYGAGIAALLVVYRRVVISTAWPILAGALVFYAAALARNRLFAVPASALPDTFAFIGTGCWLAFYAHTTVDWVEQLISGDRSAS